VTQNPQGYVAGGIVNSLVGTAELVSIAAALAIPLGVLTALYLTEFAGPRSHTGRILKIVLEVMQGLPTIIVGLFVVGLLVLPLRKQFGLAASVALAIIMLPLIARSSQEVLLLVPGTLREAADALGVNRWRSILTVVLPAATGGIVTDRDDGHDRRDGHHRLDGNHGNDALMFDAIRRHLSHWRGRSGGHAADFALRHRGDPGPDRLSGSLLAAGEHREHPGAVPPGLRLVSGAACVPGGHVPALLWLLGGGDRASVLSPHDLLVARDRCRLPFSIISSSWFTAPEASQD
jgi:hypothetical protein